MDKSKIALASSMASPRLLAREALTQLPEKVAQSAFIFLTKWIPLASRSRLTNPLGPATNWIVSPNWQ